MGPHVNDLTCLVLGEIISLIARSNLQLLGEIYDLTHCVSIEAAQCDRVFIPQSR